MVWLSGLAGRSLITDEVAHDQPFLTLLSEDPEMIDTTRLLHGTVRELLTHANGPAPEKCDGRPQAGQVMVLVIRVASHHKREIEHFDKELVDRYAAEAPRAEGVGPIGISGIILRSDPWIFDSPPFLPAFHCLAKPR